MILILDSVTNIWYFAKTLDTRYKIQYTKYVDSIYSDITLIICLAAVLTILFKFLKQPSIIAYITTGIILGLTGILPFENHKALETLGQLGITFLLFILGLELKLKELRSIGKTAVIGGLFQMGLTFGVSFGLLSLFGLSSIIAFCVAIGISFSSTIVIVKILSDKRDLTSLHGKISIGLLLVQDFFAVLTIVFLTSYGQGQDINLLTQIPLVLLKVGVLFGWIAFLSVYVFPKIVHAISRSSESLFLFSLAWVFLLTAIVTSKPIGFSLEIGGFLAGIALANAHENFQIVARMKALRDFFITIFFVVLGLQMSFDNIGEVIFPAIVISLFVLIIKPMLVMVITGLLGYRKRTSFFVGTSMAQISEFSLIILFLGQNLKIIPDEIVTMMVLVAMITFVVSTYGMQNANKLYKILSSKLDIFEFRKVNSKTTDGGDEIAVLSNHVVVIGAHQMGQSLIKALEDSGEEVLVVDFDPNVAEKLRDKGVRVIFGDISDPDIQQRVGFERAKLVVSTVPDLEDNLLLIEGLKHTNKKAVVVVMAYETFDAKALYKAGADYVVLPHLAGGRHLAKMLIDKKHLELIEDYKKKDLSALG